MINHALLPSVANATLPAKYEAAKIALAECNAIDECQSWADKTAALASYAKQSEDEELMKTAMRIRARAIRRCGELLGEFEKKHGANQNITSDTDSKVETRKEAYTKAGLSDRQAFDALRVAAVPVDLFEAQVESDDPPTITALAEQGKKKRPAYEECGMTKQQFQAGMYFHGALQLYAEETLRFEPKDVLSGLLPEEKKQFVRNLDVVDQYHKRLRKEL